MIPKFRAWLSEEQEMHNVLAFDTRGHSFLGIEGTHITVDGWCDCFEVDKQAVLMQSTGLKDKNGVEIFEGDIVKIIGDVLNDGMSVIRFVQGGFYLDYKNLDTEFELLYSVDLPIEVVGNIYEDKELLEVEG